MDQSSSNRSKYPFVRVPRTLLGRYTTYQETHPFGPSVNQMIQTDLEACPPIDFWVRPPKPDPSKTGEMVTVRVTREQLESMLEYQRKVRERAGANVTITDILTARLLYVRATAEEKSQYNTPHYLMEHLIETGGIGYGTWTLGWIYNGQPTDSPIKGKTAAQFVSLGRVQGSR